MRMRNVKKHIENYDKLVKRSNSPMMAFISGEFSELYYMSKSEYEMIYNALRFGFMVGYRYGKKERSK